MKIKVLYFGSLREKTGMAEEFLAEVRGLNELKEALSLRFEFLKALPCIWAVNQEIKNSDTVLIEGDEVAVMPPFAGG